MSSWVQLLGKMFFWIIKEVFINHWWSLLDVEERCSNWHWSWIHALERNLRGLELGECGLRLWQDAGVELIPTNKNWLLGGCVLMSRIIWDKIRQVWHLLLNRPWLLVLRIRVISGILVAYSCQVSLKVGVQWERRWVASQIYWVACTDVDITSSQLMW